MCGTLLQELPGKWWVRDGRISDQLGQRRSKLRLLGWVINVGRIFIECQEVVAPSWILIWRSGISSHRNVTLATKWDEPPWQSEHQRHHVESHVQGLGFGMWSTVLGVLWRSEEKDWQAQGRWNNQQQRGSNLDQIQGVSMSGDGHDMQWRTVTGAVSPPNNVELTPRLSDWGQLFRPYQKGLGPGSWYANRFEERVCK